MRLDLLRDEIARERFSDGVRYRADSTWKLIFQTRISLKNIYIYIFFDIRIITRYDSPFYLLDSALCINSYTLCEELLMSVYGTNSSFISLYWCSLRWVSYILAIVLFCNRVLRLNSSMEKEQKFQIQELKLHTQIHNRSSNLRTSIIKHELSFKSLTKLFDMI